ncbi:hypothetical protein AUK22_09195 [bacterium CG2_30_54_10]|nr:MAG: hypothetical protein AUK22_09195 [bacterium CG2_30_54_10]
MNTRIQRKNLSGNWFPGIFLLTMGLILLGCDTGNNVTPREGTLEGTVTDKAGTAIENVLVSWVQDPTRWGRSDSKGKFLVAGIGFGDQDFSAELAAYRTTYFKAHIYSGSTSIIQKVVMETSSFDFRDIKVDAVSATTAVISWKTTDYTNGVIEFGGTESLGWTARETANQYATVHSVRIPDLKPTTTYFFKIVASRQNRPSETSPVQSFATLATYDDLEAPATPQGVTAALTEQQNQVTIFWAPSSDRDLKGYRIYRNESALTSFAAIDSTLIAKGQERYIDAGVTPGKKLYYKVSAVDLAGNESGPSETVSMVIPGNLTQEITWIRANNPYLLSGDLTIADTGILRIDPGVEVMMTGYDALRSGNPNQVEINVSGTLVASAGSDNPITFSSENPMPNAGDWGGIKFSQASTGESALVNVTIAYAGTGLTISSASGTFADFSILHCQTGLIASKNADLTLASISLSFCQSGMEIYDNQRAVIDSCTLYHCLKGLSSARNDTIRMVGNNFIEYIDFGLTTDEIGGSVSVTNNLFVSRLGLGIHVLKFPPSVTYNTIDSPYGIRVDQGNPLIEKNILVADSSLGGKGITGIENLSRLLPVPVLGANNIVGFPVGNDYVGCASGAGSLSSEPLFMKDTGSTQYDYRLRTGFPDNLDPWGIRRTISPM